MKKYISIIFCFLLYAHNLVGVRITEIYSAHNTETYTDAFTKERKEYTPIDRLVFTNDDSNILLVGPYSAPCSIWYWTENLRQRFPFKFQSKGYEQNIISFAVGQDVVNMLYQNADFVFIDFSGNKPQGYKQDKKKDDDIFYCCGDFNKKNTNYYAIGSFGGYTVKIYKAGASSKALDVLLDKNAGMISCVKWCRKQKHTIAVGHYGFSIDVWKLDSFGEKDRNPKKIKILQSKKKSKNTKKTGAYISCMDWSYKDKNILVSGDTQGDVVVWDVEAGKSLHKIEAHKECVNDIVFHPIQYHIFFTCSSDSYIKAWNAKTGKQVGSFWGHFAKVRCMCINKKGNFLASGDFNGKICVSKLEFEKSDYEEK